MKNFLILTCLFLFIQPAIATVWITLADSKSHKIGVIGASSGYIGDYRTMVSADNQAIAVVGSWYLERRQSHLIETLSDPNLSAKQMALVFSDLINQDRHKRRVSLVTAKFENASEPGRGCHDRNYYCGKYESKNFSITGGGLVSEEVILKTKEVLEDERTRNLPFECQLQKGITSIFESGGEIKLFNRIAIQVDDTSLKNDSKGKVFYRRGPENSLLSQLQQHLVTLGINCNMD